MEFRVSADGENYSGVGGAKFLLYYDEDGAAKLVTVQLVNGSRGSYRYTGMTEATDEAKSANAIVSSSASDTLGKVSVSGLPWGSGTYYFVESKEPNGYETDTEKKYPFTVTWQAAGAENGTGAVVTTYNAKSGSTTASSDTFTQAVSGDVKYMILSSAENGTVTMQDAAGDSKKSSSSSSSSSEATVETAAYGTDSTSETETTADAAVEQEFIVPDEDKDTNGRNIKTEDKTPLALYLILSVVTLGVFAVLTLLIRIIKKRGKI